MPTSSMGFLSPSDDPAWAPLVGARNALYGAQSANANAQSQTSAAQGNLFASLLSMNKGEQRGGLDTISRLFQSLLGGGSSGSGFGSSMSGGYNALGDKLVGLIDQQGAGRKQEINQGFQDTTNNAVARLSDRGIGGSTYSVNAFQGAERGRQQSLNTLNDQLLGQKVDALSRTGLAGLNAESGFQQNMTGSLFQQLLGGLF